MSIAHDLPQPYGEPIVAAPALRLVPAEPMDFDEAVRSLRPRLHRYAIRRLGDAHEAEELVQEALLRAYSHREQLETEDDLSAWTTVVTGRLVIDRLRVRGRSTSVADVPETGRLGRDTADIVVARDEARTALDSLDAMPPRQAALLWAREVEGLSYDDLCTRFAMTEPAVRSVLTRARKALRKEYALRGGTLPVGGLAVVAPWIAGLSWADKLRSAVGRITAPAALATVGVTALGGLIMAPFGGAFAPSTSPFQPAQAVITASSTPAAEFVPHGFQVAPRSDTPAQSRSARLATENDREGAAEGLLRSAPKVIPCQEANTVPLPTPSGYGLPTGTPGLGNGDCYHRKNSILVSLPYNPVTGERKIGIESETVECKALEPITSQPHSPLTCTTKETQP